MRTPSYSKGGIDLVWPYRMQEHPDDPENKLSSQQILEKVMAPNAPYTRIGFGGPKGGGKSYGARAMAMTISYLFPVVVVLVRSRLTSLKRNHILPAKNELRDWLDAGIIDYNEQDKIFYMPGGGMVQFMYCATMGDVDNFEGVPGDVYIFEEGGQFTKSMIQGIIKNNRSSDLAINRGTKYRPRALFTFNWGGPGHSLLRRWFWDRIFEDKEDSSKYFYIFAALEQNRALLDVNPEYKQNLLELPEQLRRAYLDGDPDAFVGTMFMVLRRYHEVNPVDVLAPYHDPDVPKRDFRIPSDWLLVGSLDAGIGAPCAFGLYAITPKNDDGERTIYKIFTYKDIKRNAPLHVEAIVEKIENCKWTGGEMPEFIVSDKYAFQESNNMGVAGGDITWEDLFAVHHLPLYQVSYKRVTAIMALQTALHFEFDPQTDDLELPPIIQFFEGENAEAFDELQAAIRSEANPEDLDKKAEDHVIDEMKNMVLCSESPPTFVPVKKVKEPDPKADYGSRIDRMKELFGLGGGSSWQDVL